MEMTLNLEKALEWLKKYPKTRQVIEYLVSEDSISKEWCGLWYYDEDEVLRHETYGY